MNLPGVPTKVGDLVAWANRVNDYLRSLTPQGAGVSTNSSGTTIRPVAFGRVWHLGRGPRFIEFTFTAAGDIPTQAEIETGIEAAYTAGPYVPVPGDFLYSDAFNYIVSSRNVEGDVIETLGRGIFRVLFQVNGVNYVAMQTGPNRLY
jgi:hypothetical protein